MYDNKRKGSESMRKRVFFVLVLALLLTYSALASASSPQSFTIQVQASGVVVVPPNKAQLWVGVETDAETPKAALDTANEVIGRLLDIFGQYTTPQLVKTHEFSMYANEQWDETVSKFVARGYSVRHVFEVHLLDLDRVPSFLDDVTNAGANVMYGLQYNMFDYREPRAEAMKKAMEEAWWKAGAIAEANSATGLVLENVNEEMYVYNPEVSLASLVDEDSDAGFAQFPLQVTATVTATFRAFLPEN
jgi:uncharacterized protein YggE